MKLGQLIMNEITLFCRDECSGSDCCPEEERMLYRIERICDMDKNEKAIEYCESLLSKYDRNREITDIDICHITEILKGRE